MNIVAEALKNVIELLIFHIIGVRKMKIQEV